MNSSRSVFILGSGFSRAFSQAMPTVRELTDRFQASAQFQRSPYNRLVENPELLLSYLDLAQPWKEPEEALRDRALFVETQKDLAGMIEISEEHAFRPTVPDWAGALVHHFHGTQAAVITLNYDTVLERILHKTVTKGSSDDGPREFDLYDLPLSVLRQREGGTFAGEEVETFRLVKLHGSINWFYSGCEVFPGEQIYYRPVNSDSPFQDDLSRQGDPDREARRLTRDKTPLIVPPVSEKSRFFENRTVRALWTAAREVLAQASEVWCVGYSLPETDLTMKLFLRSVAQPKRVILVNEVEANDEHGRELVRTYKDKFSRARVDRSFMGPNSVARMVGALVR